MASYLRLFQTFLSRVGNDIDQEESTNGPFFSTTTNNYALDPLLANLALRNYVIKVYLSPGSIFKTKRVGLKESIHNMYEYIWVFNRFIFLSNIRVCFKNYVSNLFLPWEQ